MYIYSVGLFLGKISVCVCCTLAFKCSMSSAGSSGMTGTGSDSTGCSSDLHKKSQVKEMSVSVHKIEAFRSCSRFHTLCISSLLVFDISWYLLISLVAMFGMCCTVFLFLTLKLVSQRTVLRPVRWMSQPELGEEMGTTKALKTVGSCVAWYQQWYGCDILIDACDTSQWHRIP